MLITLFIMFDIWAFVAVGLHIHRHQFYKKRPHLNNRRGEGLIAFSERQYWWMMTLWPLAIVACMLYCIVLVVCAVLEMAVNLWEQRRRVPK